MGDVRQIRRGYVPSGPPVEVMRRIGDHVGGGGLTLLCAATCRWSSRKGPPMKTRRSLTWAWFVSDFLLRIVSFQDARSVRASCGLRRYFGIGSTIVAFSVSETSPGLPAMRYWTFNCLTTSGAGSPPKFVMNSPS